MKLKILILTLLTLISLSCSAQDSKFALGGGWLRWDSDSSMFKFSNKIGMESNLPLFKYNPDQFNWSLSNGLTLKNPPNDTSISLKRFTIYRDSIVNENIKSRTYTFLKPYYAHQYDLFDLVVNYQSNENGTVVENKNINLFNNCYTIYDNQELNQVLTEGAFSFGWSFTNMKKGQYFITINYEYDIDNVAIKSLEQLDAVLLNLDNMFEYAHNTHTFVHTDNFPSGQINSGTMSCVITPTNSENKNINLTFQANSGQNQKIKLCKLRVLAILLN